MPTTTSLPRSTQRLQAAMRLHGMDALLLGGDASGAFAGGHRRLKVHGPGWPLPMVALGVEGLPHVVSADPDGAEHLPADHVHGITWDPDRLVEQLPSWLGAAGDGTVGLDMLSPRGFEIVRTALPRARLVDASHVLAQAMVAKEPDEIGELRVSCERACAALDAGLSGGMPAMARALAGAFLIGMPHLGARSARVAILRDGFAGEARRGPGRKRSLETALGLLSSKQRVADLAGELPGDVEISGLGRGYEPPVVSRGWASPPELELVAGAVLCVRSGLAGVTAVVAQDGPVLLSPPPGEVVR